MALPIFSSVADIDCRVCASNKGLLPIFGNESVPDISLEMSRIGGIQINENDDFPKFICNDCFQLLEGAITFRRLAKKTDNLLRRRKKKNDLLSKKSNSNTPVKIETKTPINDNIQTVTVVEAEFDFVSMKCESKVEDSTDLKDETKLGEDVLQEHYDFDLDDDNIVEVQDNHVKENDNEMVMLIVSEDKKRKEQNAHCKVCNLGFTNSEKYEEHRNSVEHKRNYVISFLPKKTNSESKPTVNPKDRKCEICNRMFTKLHYPKHMKTEHQVEMETSRSTKKRECPVCKRLFHPVALNRHMKKAHTDEKDLPPKVKLECPICKKLFSKDFYPLHMQRHKEGDAKNYICDQCGKKFFFKSTFYTHRLIHSNELPHKCMYCPYRGRTKGLLKTHVRTHTGDYPYKCTQCETRCLTKSNLNAHMQRHRGPVDFICDTCSRGFYSKLELERHISVIHQGIRSHVCDICGMAFGYRHGLMSHQLNVHKRAKGVGKAKAVYLKLEEEGVLQPLESIERQYQ